MKNKWILGCVLLVLICLCLLPPATKASDDWPMFRQNLNHTADVPSNSTYNSAKLNWNYTTKGSIYSSPAVLGDYVVVGSKDSNIYCFNASNGEKLWSFLSGAEVVASPAIKGDCVYISSDDGWFYCLNLSSGIPIWIEWIGGNANSCPAIDGDFVFVGSGIHDVICFNVTDGKEIWRCPTSDKVMSSPAVFGGILYVACDDFRVYAINVSSGALLWKTATGSADSAPAVYNGCVYIGSNAGYVLCLDAKNGSILWTYQSAGAITSSPAISEGCVFVGSEDNYVYCINATNGQLVWKSETGYLVCSSPAVLGGCLYVGSEDYSIYCINVSTGQKLWVYSTGNQVVSSPTVVNDKLYIGSFDRNIYAFTLFNTTITPTTIETYSALNWSTLSFDVIACLVGAIILLLFFNYAKTVRQEQKLLNQENRGKFSWLIRHSDVVCLLVILGFALTFYLNLEGGILWPADEQTYSQMAYYMLKSGDYLNPHGFGELAIWTGKPPLIMWLISLSYQMFGVTNFATRFVMPLFGAASMVLLYYLGKKLYNRMVGIISALILVSFTMFQSLATHAMIDVPLTCFVLASFYFFILCQKTESPNRYVVLSGVFFGLAFLAKQTSALLIPAIVFVYLLLSERSLRPLFTKRVALFLCTAGLLVVPWLLYMSFTFGFDFWNSYFLYGTVGRFSGAIEGHAQSYLFYFDYFVTHEVLLWVVLLPFAVGVSAYFAYRRSKADVLLVCWIVVVWLVFTVAQTKLFYYVLPAFPAFALAIGVLFYRVWGWLFRRQKSVGSS